MEIQLVTCVQASAENPEGYNTTGRIGLAQVLLKSTVVKKK